MCVTSEALLEAVPVIETPDIAQLVTEDDTPVDNLPSEKQQRLLVEPLYSSWDAGRPFLAASNVGIFSAVNRPPVVPDMFLSLDVQVAEDWWARQHRSYFLWEFGKPPDLVVEIVSNMEGEETGRKFYE
jgi:Uma2 family endonuclease